MKIRFSRLRHGVIIALLSVTIMLQAAEDKSKNGVSINSISLPSGPGSIQGLGEAFQPSLNTGTGRQVISISMPPGTTGHHPSISLTYDGGEGNGILGYGWNLPLPFVQRQTDKGTPRYIDSPDNLDNDYDDVIDNPEELDRFISASSEELVPTSSSGTTNYFAENEGAFIRYRRVGSHWEAHKPDGGRMIFGETAQARIVDSSDPSKIFRWLIEKDIDVRGNEIRFSYTSFAGAENLNQKYISQVSYGPGTGPWAAFHFIRLSYQTRTDWFEDCRPGFQLRTGVRLQSIHVGTQGVVLSGHLAGDFNQDSQADYLHRVYSLGYHPTAPVSLLESVQMIGADGVTPLPSASYSYTLCSAVTNFSASGTLLSSINEPPSGFELTTIDLADLNGDGLPDLLRTLGTSHRAYFNEGERSIASGGSGIRWSAPVDLAKAATGANPLTLSLADDAVSLSDVDGDGLSDLLLLTTPSTSTPSTFVFTSEPTGQVPRWSARRSLTAIANDYPPSPYGSNGTVKSIDVDFDKRMDVVKSVPSGGSFIYQVWLNKEGTSHRRRGTFSPPNGYDFSDATVKVGDLNGDRLTDIARIRSNRIEFTVSLGRGSFLPQESVTLAGAALTTTQMEKAVLQDVTGDGLADVVVERPSPGVLWIWPNRGNRTFGALITVTGLPPVFSSSVATRWADINGNGTTDLVLADDGNVVGKQIQTLDLGRLMGCVPRPFLMNSISNGIGRTETLIYTTTTEFILADGALPNDAYAYNWPTPLPFPITVFKEIRTSDGNGHEYVKQVSFHDGYYDAEEKQFRGFARVEQLDIGDATAPSLKSRYVFDTGALHEVLKGSVLEVSSEADGGTFSSEITEWAIKALHAGDDERNVLYAHPQRKTLDILEQGRGTPRQRLSEMDYDNYGNQIALRDYGVVEGANRSAFNDERFTSTQYAINTALWILRTPAQLEVGDENGALISRSRMFYDDETFSAGNFQQVTRGELTLKQEWVNPAAGPIIKAARTKYDTYGNVMVLLDPLATDDTGGHVRRIGWDTVFHSYPVTETIQLGGGKAPLLYTAEYDVGFGVVTAATDFNSQRTDFGYDVFARLTTMVKPGDTLAMPTAEYSYHLAVPHGTGGIINFVETRTLDRDVAAPGSKQDHYLNSREFVDGLGRKVLSKTEAEPATPGGAPRVAVNGAVLFNARTKPSAALNPFFSVSSSMDFENIEAPGWSGIFSQNGALVSLGLAAAHKSSTIYDATGRDVEIINPDGTRKHTVFEPLITRSFDENDNDPASPNSDTPMVHHQDGLGRLIRVDEITRLNDDGTPAGSLKTWTTRYAYDLNDQLVTITDSQNNLKRQLFDGLKRMTWMNDPDRGVMAFLYDDASNLTESTDAKGQRIIYTYDEANRILTEDYLDEGLPFSRNFLFNPALPVSAVNRPDVAYFYDAAVPGLSMGDGSTATAGHVLGRLTTVWDLSGEEHTSYDSRGRIDWAVKRITDPKHGGLVSFRTGFGYDSLDRLRRVEYPDGDFVPYEYNERSLLARIAGGPSGHIIAGVDYLPSGQMSAQQYGNFTRTDYTYDPRLRLKTLLTSSTALGSQLLHYAYDFDAVSNLRSITDSRPVSAVPAGDARRNTQIFGYDDLYRITSVQYSFAAPGAAVGDNGGIAYRYDRIGNLLSQTSGLNHVEKGLPVTNLGSLSYGGTAGTSARSGRAGTDPPGPHALTAVNGGSRTYPYDANGNMTLLDDMVSTWDFKDRLVTVETPEMRADYVYDYTDRRITKHVTQKAAPGDGSTVLYVGKHFEVREGETPTKFIWNGETRVARVTGSLSTNVRVQRLRLAQGWNLVSLAIDSTESLSKLQSSAPAVTLEAHLHQPASGTFAPLAANSNLPAGSVLWVKASTSATLHLLGTMPNAPPVLVPITPQGKFYSTGFDGLTLANQPTEATIWRFFSESQLWQTKLAPPLQALSDAPAKLPSGEAVLIQSPTAADVQIPDSALAIRYYHQDHLGSSSVMTDATGHLVEENTYYPFGHPRQEHRPRGVREDYQFTQKERDAESGLNYFEARFLAASLGRFTRVDPLASAMPQAWIGVPQKMNLYAYCANQPIVCVDPTGLDPVQGILTNYADQVGGYLAENGGGTGAFVGTGIYTAAAYLDPTENAANAGEQLGIAFDTSKSGLDRLAGGFGALGYSAATALDVFGFKAVNKLLSKGGGVVSDIAGSALHVNPKRGTMNCVNCSIATDSKLGGSPSSAMPGQATPISVLEEMYGGKFKEVSGMMEIGSILSKSGDGARGIVFGASKNGQVGHVWNAVNQGGTVRFLDGQTGATAGKAADNFVDFDSFKFLPTKGGE